MVTMKHSSLRVIIYYTLWALLPTFCAADCYYPNNDLASGSGTDYTSCASNSGSDASCCDTANDGVCQPNGLCQAPSSYDHAFYRGACTDKTWKSPNCPDYCLGSVAYNQSYVWISDCGSGNFCCSTSYSDNACCNGKTFQVTSTPGSSNSTATPSATPTPSGTLAPSTIGGIVAGCVVGVALIVGGILFATMPSFRRLVLTWVKNQGGKHTGEQPAEPQTGETPVPQSSQGLQDPVKKPLQYDLEV